VGTALAWADKGEVLWWVVVLTLLSSLFIQVGTNLVNDVVDFKKGADDEKRVGPQRVTQSGLIAPKTVFIMAAVCFLVAVLCGVPLVFRGGMPIFIVGLVSVLMGYGYTAGPFPLAYRGLGDVFVILFFGLIAVGGVYFLHTLELSMNAIIAGFQVGFLATVLIAINNLRDIDGDKKVHKRTLPVRFGKRFARIEIAGLALGPFVLGFYWYSLDFFWPFVLPWLVFPLAVLIVKMIFATEPGPAYNLYLAKSALLQLMFCFLLAAGFFL